MSASTQSAFQSSTEIYGKVPALEFKLKSLLTGCPLSAPCFFSVQTEAHTCPMRHNRTKLQTHFSRFLHQSRTPTVLKFSLFDQQSIGTFCLVWLFPIRYKFSLSLCSLSRPITSQTSFAVIHYSLVSIAS